MTKGDILYAFKTQGVLEGSTAFPDPLELELITWQYFRCTTSD